MKIHRKIYQESLDIILPKELDIHHIDFNHKNNDIKNLVALPKSIHSKYHAAVTGYVNMPPLPYEISFSLCSMAFSAYLFMMKDSMEKLDSAISECAPYIYYRDFLLGLVPEIFPDFKPY